MKYNYTLGPCTAWNISIHEYSERSDDKAGQILYTFCPRDKNATNTLPWQMNIVVIKYVILI